MLLALILVPIVLGAGALVLPTPRARAWLVPVSAVIHAARVLTAAASMTFRARGGILMAGSIVFARWIMMDFSG